jgi:hypothetical protein
MTTINPLYNSNGNPKQSVLGDNLNSKYINNVDFTAITEKTVKLTGQTIDVGATATNPVYYNINLAGWYYATKDSVAPQGIYIGSSTVILSGYSAGFTGLTAGADYYLNDAGGLSMAQGTRKCRIGYAISTTEMIIKILDPNIYTKTYGFFGGGTGAPNNVIDYITVATTTQNAIDTGDLSQARLYLCGVSGQVYGFFAGGDRASDSADSNVIDYISLLLTTQNATDVGDMTVARHSPCGVNGSLYGFIGGGYADVPTNVDIIEYIILLTLTQNAVDTGNLTVARSYAAGVNGTTYGFFAGGFFVTDTIDRIALATISQNASDVGNLINSPYAATGVSGPTYGFFGGGNTGVLVNVIQYIVLATATQNATDTGDLSGTKSGMAGTSGSTYGFFGGYDDTIDQIVLATTTQNASDIGNLTVSRQYLGGV